MVISARQRVKRTLARRRNSAPTNYSIAGFSSTNISIKLMAF